MPSSHSTRRASMRCSWNSTSTCTSSPRRRNDSMSTLMYAAVSSASGSDSRLSASTELGLRWLSSASGRESCSCTIESKKLSETGNAGTALIKTTVHKSQSLTKLLGTRSSDRIPGKPDFLQWELGGISAQGRAVQRWGIRRSTGASLGDGG
eukprot:363865-Chlamydomonas_euryale.AAC.33